MFRVHINPEAQVITRRIRQILPNTQVPLRGGDRSVAQAQLNLLQGRPPLMSQLRKRAAEVVRGQTADSDLRPVLPDHLEDGLRGHTGPGDPSATKGGMHRQTLCVAGKPPPDCGSRNCAWSHPWDKLPS